MDINSVFNSQNSIANLVSQYMRLESQPKTDLLDQKNELSQRRTILTSLNTKLSALRSSVQTLNDPVIDYFTTKKASSSDTDLIKASASYSATASNHSIQVERLAQSDTRFSKQLNDADSSFAAFASDQTFSITVASPTEEDENNRISIDVTISADTFSKADDEVLADVASAINDAFYNAIGDETLEPDEKAIASVVKEESGTSRLVLKSAQTGYANRLELADSADSLLSFLELNSSSQYTGTSGGYLHNVGTGVTDSELNSKFTVDGLTIYRDSNTVTDVLTGVTLNLQDTFDTDETITVSSDTDAVKGYINSFIKAYNDSLDFLGKNALVDPDTKEVGVLAYDNTYRSIINDLRSMISGTVDGVTNSAYGTLYSIGIETDDNGKLSIADSEKFQNALDANPDYIGDIFRQEENGIAVKFESYLDNYVNTGGRITISQQSIDRQVTNLDSRIKTLDEYLLKREDSLFDEFARMQDAMAKLSSQQSYMSQFTYASMR
jgi:flagellar hook-associated protein 2